MLQHSNKINSNRIYFKHVKLLKPLYYNEHCYVQKRDGGHLFTHVSPITGEVTIILLSIPYCLPTRTPSYSVRVVSPAIESILGESGLSALLKALEYLGLDTNIYE